MAAEVTEEEEGEGSQQSVKRSWRRRGRGGPERPTLEDGATTTLEGGAGARWAGKDNCEPPWLRKGWVAGTSKVHDAGAVQE